LESKACTEILRKAVIIEAVPAAGYNYIDALNNPRERHFPHIVCMMTNNPNEKHLVYSFKKHPFKTQNPTF